MTIDPTTLRAAQAALRAALAEDDAAPTAAGARAVRAAQRAVLAAEPVPHANDAQGWDEYRQRRGYSGCHH